MNIVKFHRSALDEWAEQKDLKYHVSYNMFSETVWNKFLTYNLCQIRSFYSYGKLALFQLYRSLYTDIFLVFNFIFLKPPNLIRIVTF